MVEYDQTCIFILRMLFLDTPQSNFFVWPQVEPHLGQSSAAGLSRGLLSGLLSSVCGSLWLSLSQDLCFLRGCQQALVGGVLDKLGLFHQVVQVVLLGQGSTPGRVRVGRKPQGVLNLGLCR